MRSLLLLIICFSISFHALAQDNDAVDSLIVKLNSRIFLEHIPNDTTDGYFKLHDSINGSTKAVRVKLTGKSAMGSVLEIFNPYETPFTYKAYLYNFKKKKYEEANVFPVQPRMGTRDMWPFPMEYILIKKFKFEKE